MSVLNFVIRIDDSQIKWKLRREYEKRKYRLQSSIITIEDNRVSIKSLTRGKTGRWSEGWRDRFSIAKEERPSCSKVEIKKQAVQKTCGRQPYLRRLWNYLIKHSGGKKGSRKTDGRYTRAGKIDASERMRTEKTDTLSEALLLSSVYKCPACDIVITGAARTLRISAVDKNIREFNLSIKNF